MTKLLRAGFSRLKNDKMFWIGNIFMIVIGIIIPLKSYFDARGSGYMPSFDSYFFGFALFTGVIAAVFISLFVGTEYSDGTMRNKIVVGHTRSAIYLSNFIVNITAAFITNLAFIITVSAVGIPLFGTLTISTKSVLLLLSASILMTVAFSAIFTLLAMLIQSRTIVAIVCILGVVAMFVISITINQRLSEPEFYESFTYTATGESDEVTDLAEGVEKMPNPNYLQPKQRVVYEFFYDLLPTGQSMQISQRATPHPWQMMLYSLCIILATTSSGVFFFRKKDLK